LENSLLNFHHYRDAAATEVVTDWNIDTPRDICVSGTKVIVSDQLNNRILIWNSVPTKNGASASVVLGQPDFTTSDANHGGVSASSVSGPIGLLCQGGKLYVADVNNSRILIWNSIPTSNFTPADLQLGQPDFLTATSNTGARSGARLAKANDLATDGTNLFVADTNNHRVLMWPTLSPASGSTATVVLGQAVSFTTGTSGTSNIKFKTPGSIDIISGKMYLSDTGNQRVLIWDAVPTVTNTAANRVLGQIDLNTAGISAPAKNNFSQPMGVASTAGGAFYIADGVWSRLLIFNSAPAGNNGGADSVYGQTSFLTSSPVGSRSPELTATYGTPGRDGNKIIVPDGSHCRTMLWNNSANLFTSPPDIVFGQANIQSAICQTVPTSTTMRSITQAAMEGGRIAITDRLNSRILLWNTTPATNGAAADLVLGQSDFVTATANTGGIAMNSLSGPVGLTISNGKVIVTDTNNNRVLIWNSWPTINNQAADVLLGQALSSTANVNDGGISAASFSAPRMPLVYQGKLFIADAANNRILVWNSIPTVNNQPADLVIGQPDFVSSTAYYSAGSINSKGFVNPTQIYFNGGKFFVGDTGSYRTMIWNSIPKPGDPAAVIIGIPAFASTHDISADPTSITTGAPNGIFPMNGDFWISESFWRTIRFPGYGE
jgi:hypothetical protein